MSSKKRPVDDWIDAVFDSDLPAAARFVAVALARHMDWHTLADARPGPARLALKTGLHIATVKRHLALLCERGWLVKLSKGGSLPSGKRIVSVYQGAYPSPCAPGAEDDPSFYARRPVAQDASTRRPVRDDPSHRTTPPSEGPGQRPGHEQSAARSSSSHGSSAGAPLSHFDRGDEIEENEENSQRQAPRGPKRCSACDTTGWHPGARPGDAVHRCDCNPQTASWSDDPTGNDDPEPRSWILHRGIPHQYCDGIWAREPDLVSQELVS